MHPSQRSQQVAGDDPSGILDVATMFGPNGRLKIALALCTLLLTSLACALPGRSSETQAPVPDESTGIGSERTPESQAAATPDSRLDESACDRVPESAIEHFLYDFNLDQRVAELDPDGVYCRFESVVVEGQGADLGRGLAATTVKLWDSTGACLNAASSGSGSEVEAPEPWSFVSVTAWPDKPELIVSVTAIEGDRCVTVSAPDISSQPLEHWIEFLDAIVASL